MELTPLIGYLATAVISASCGFLTGSVMAASKVSDLFERVATLEQQSFVQVSVISSLVTAITESSMLTGSDEVVSLANEILHRARKLV